MLYVYGYLGGYFGFVIAAFLLVYDEVVKTLVEEDNIRLRVAEISTGLSIFIKGLFWPFIVIYGIIRHLKGD
jgi:hypothetical protein